MLHPDDSPVGPVRHARHVPEERQLTCAAVYDWTGNETLARGATWLIGKPLAILAILIGAVVVRWLATKAIDRVIKRAETAPAPGARHTHNRRAQRARSLGTLLKSITTTVVFGIAFVMALSEIGMDVAPILASAGVLGLAIGFGAQNLVKDFLSGVMMMVEDQYGVGDAVDLGEAIGTVENVGLRVTRVRDVDGTVWYVRNGEILRVGNQSQNWARTVLDISVSYAEDLTRVRQVLTEVAHSPVGGRGLQGRHHRGARGLGRAEPRPRRRGRPGDAEDRSDGAVERRPRDARADQGPLRPRGHRDAAAPAGGLAPRAHAGRRPVDSPVDSPAGTGSAAPGAHLSRTTHPG